MYVHIFNSQIAQILHTYVYNFPAPPFSCPNGNPIFVVPHFARFEYFLTTHLQIYNNTTPSVQYFHFMFVVYFILTLYSYLSHSPFLKVSHVLSNSIPLHVHLPTKIYMNGQVSNEFAACACLYVYVVKIEVNVHGLHIADTFQ